MLECLMVTCAFDILSTIYYQMWGNRNLPLIWIVYLMDRVLFVNNVKLLWLYVKAK